jgi:hypothetical protein
VVVNAHRNVGCPDAGGSRHGATRVTRVTRGHRSATAAVAASLTVAALSVSAVPADAAVTGGQSIEVHTESNRISLAGYPADAEVRVEVLRQGFVLGQAVKTTDATGVVEMNHVGAKAGDCFDPPSSPDVMPGDTIRTTVLDNPANRDTSVVRGVWVDDVRYGVPTARDITVSGRLSLDGADRVVPGAHVLELRIDKDTNWTGTGRTDLREKVLRADVRANGRWSHVMTAPTAADVAEARAGSETFLEWAAAAGESPSELTVAELGPRRAPAGCPPLQQGPTAPRLARAMDSGRVGDHVTNRSANLTFSGLAGSDLRSDDAGPGTDAVVELFVDGVSMAMVMADSDGAYRFTGLRLAPRARVYSLMVQAKDPGDAPTFGSVVRRVRVDAAAPAVVQRRLAPNPLHLEGPERLHGVYRVGEAARVDAKIQRLLPTRTVTTFGVRNAQRAGLVEYDWGGRNELGQNVRPGRYRMVLTATDRAGNRATRATRFRVVG